MLVKYRQWNLSKIQECKIERQWDRDIASIPECERHVKMMAGKFKLRGKEN